MNPFVNPKNRGVLLPKGCKDLVDVLRGAGQAKCEYCGAIAVATLGWPNDFRWCAVCQQDLREFAAGYDFTFYLDTCDEAAKSRFRAEFQRRLDDFMRQRVKARMPQ